MAAREPMEGGEGRKPMREPSRERGRGPAPAPARPGSGARAFPGSRETRGGAGPAQRAAGEALRGEGGGGGGWGGGAGVRAARARARAPSRPRRRSAPAGCVARRARAFRRCAPGRC